MSRVVIVGIAGGGKSTLARRISASLGLPLHQMDKIGWLPGWKLAGNAHVEGLHDELMTLDRWVIDGSLPADWAAAFDPFMKMRGLYLFVLNHRNWSGDPAANPKRGFLNMLRGSFERPIEW